MSVDSYSSSTVHFETLLPAKLRATPALLTPQGRLERQKGQLLPCSLTCSITMGLGIPGRNSYL